MKNLLLTLITALFENSFKSVSRFGMLFAFMAFGFLASAQTTINVSGGNPAVCAWANGPYTETGVGTSVWTKNGDSAKEIIRVGSSWQIKDAVIICCGGASNTSIYASNPGGSATNPPASGWLGLCAGHYTLSGAGVYAPPPPSCDNSTAAGGCGQFPAGPVTVDSEGDLTLISASSTSSGQYSQVTGIIGGESLEFITSGGGGGYVTVYQDGVNTNLLGSGFAPFVVTAITNGDLYVHWTEDAACNIECVGAAETTVQYVSGAGCSDPTGLSASDITATGFNANWTSGNTGDGEFYSVYVVLDGGTPSTADAFGAAVEGSNSVAITTYDGGTPFVAGSDYDLYVQEDCEDANGGVSSLIGPFDVTQELAEASFVLSAPTAAEECQEFTMTVAIETNTALNVAEAYIDFDNTALVVLSVTGPNGAALPLAPLLQQAIGVDIGAINTNGQIAYSAGNGDPNNLPSADFPFLEVTFSVLNPAGISSITPVTSGFPESVIGIINFVNGIPTPVNLLDNGSAAPISVDLTPDVTAPVISDCPADIPQFNEVGLCGATATWTPPTAIDACGLPTVSSTHNPGDFFTVGTTAVTYTFTDAAGNTATCSFTVTVNDTEVPVITDCPDDISINNDPGLCGATLPDYTSQATATDNCPFATGFAKVSAGESYTLAIGPDGSLWAWGYNLYGNFGNGTTSNSSIPIKIGTDTDWLTISSGRLSSLAIKTDGTLWGWGANFSGQLGDGSTTNRLTPVQIGTAINWQSIANGYGGTGNTHSLGIQADGTLWAWGANYDGQLGIGSLVAQSSPTQVGTDDNWVSVDAGERHTVALKSDGSMWTWGQNNSDQLGNNNRYTNQLSPIHVGSDTWITAKAGRLHNLAIRSDGTLWVWGLNQHGQLGAPGTGVGVTRPAPYQISADIDWESISAGWYDNLALKSDGSLWAWGTSISYNTLAQFGTATDWNTIETGAFHSMAFKNDGSLLAWGNNSQGQLGTGGSGGSTPEVVQVPVFSPVDQSPAPGTLLPLGANTITYTVTDVAGNTAICTQIVTVVDNEDPIISVPADAVANCDNIPAAAAVTATDNCDASPVVALAEVSTQGIDPLLADYYNYTITRTWTATDVAGNSVDGIQVITVSDNIAPVLAGVPADVNASCENIPALASPTATDFCDANPAVTIESNSTQGNDPALADYYNYTITRTWTATDVAGNNVDGVQVITVSDNNDPVLVGVPVDANASCDNIPAVATVTATDNCDASPVVILLSEVSTQGTDIALADYYNYAITRTWTATDVAGNSVDGIQVITVSDNTGPVITCAPGATLLTNQSNSTYLLSGTGFDATAAADNCGGAVTIIHNAGSISGASGPNNNSLDGWELPLGINIITFTASDVVGNVDDCTVTIEVQNASLSGTATINLTCAPFNMRVLVYELDGGNQPTTQVAGDFFTTIDANGDFSLNLPGVAQGSYGVFFKVETYLQQLYVVDLSTGSGVQGLTSIIPGDIDFNPGDAGDLYYNNSVSLNDLTLLLIYFNTAVDGGDAGSVRSDLNCDGVVSGLDLSLLLFFFNQGGDFHP